jgi:cellulose synthase/poly-beta-1,6-N-acetylglucosamine synthase-like glycosyltransferase
MGMSMLAIWLLLWVFASALLIPIAFFTLECILAFSAGPRRRQFAAATRPRIAVLIPAHNEETEIQQTLASVVPQLTPGDRVVVIADNCTDQTAERARVAGAEVVERFDTERRGKGYALDFGIKALNSSLSLSNSGAGQGEGFLPDVVIFIDADCRVEADALDELAAAAAESNRPAQAVYLFQTPARPSPIDCLSAFAVRVKNWVRPLGLHRAGLPCLLMGSGMAFPWAVLRDASLASGNIVEDLQMGIDLTLAGHPPILCPAARVTGMLPSQASAAITQRTRWEHGHLNLIVTQFPRLLVKGLLSGNVSILAVALEISVPPISLLVASWFILSLAVLGIAGWLHQLVPVFVVAAGWVVLGAGVLLAWARFGHDLISFSTMLSIPFYVLRKLPLYRAFLQKRQTSWVRTAREGELASAPLPQRVAEQLIGSPVKLGVRGDADVDLPCQASQSPHRSRQHRQSHDG